MLRLFPPYSASTLSIDEMLLYTLLGSVIIVFSIHTFKGGIRKIAHVLNKRTSNRMIEYKVSMKDIDNGIRLFSEKGKAVTFLNKGIVLVLMVYFLSHLVQVSS